MRHSKQLGLVDSIKWHFVICFQHQYCIITPFLPSQNEREDKYFNSWSLLCSKHKLNQLIRFQLRISWRRRILPASSNGSNTRRLTTTGLSETVSVSKLRRWTFQSNFLLTHSKSRVDTYIHYCLQLVFQIMRFIPEQSERWWWTMRLKPWQLGIGCHWFNVWKTVIFRGVCVCGGDKHI